MTPNITLQKTSIEVLSLFCLLNTMFSHIYLVDSVDTIRLGIIPIGLVFALLSANYFALIADTLFRGGKVAVSKQVYSAPRLGIERSLYPRLRFAYLGLLKYGLFETDMENIV